MVEARAAALGRVLIGDRLTGSARRRVLRSARRLGGGAAAIAAGLALLCVGASGPASARGFAEPPQSGANPPQSGENPPPPGANPPPPSGTGRRAPFAPGVLIDWPARTVEVEAKVVLREGALELFACSPNTREHESILRVEAAPKDIFMALGLIGLTPGSPAHYDPAQSAWRAPTGQRVRLEVQFERDGQAATVAAGDWMLDVKTRKPPEGVQWVFAGSRTFESGRFGADADGTVVCVVDFDTALITVAGLHTADNEALWLEAHTDAIPPLGTPCVLKIAAFDAERRLVIDLRMDGSLRYGSQSLSVAEAARLFERESSDSARGRVRLILRQDRHASYVVVQSVLDALRRAGVPDDAVTVSSGDEAPRVANPTPPRP